MSHVSMLDTEIGEAVMSALNELGGSEGLSLGDIERHLSSVLINAPDLESIQSTLNNAVDKGLVLKLDSGKYKIKGSERCREEEIDDGNDFLKAELQKILDDADKLEKIASIAIEAAQECRSLVEKFEPKMAFEKDKSKEPTRCDEELQDANSNAEDDEQNLEDDSGSVISSVGEEDRSFTLRESDDKDDEKKDTK